MRLRRHFFMPLMCPAQSSFWRIFPRCVYCNDKRSGKRTCLSCNRLCFRRADFQGMPLFHSPCPSFGICRLRTEHLHLHPRAERTGSGNNKCLLCHSTLHRSLPIFCHSERKPFTPVSFRPRPHAGRNRLRRA